MTSLRKGATGETLRVHVTETQEEAAQLATLGAVSLLRSLLATQPTVRVMFAAAVSQERFLARLRREPGIAWSRVHAFQLDEYVGLPVGHPASFAQWLRHRLFDSVRPAAVFALDPSAPAGAECERYAALLMEAPIDIAFIGIGENGHLAFNDPWVADFDDPRLARVVPLDEISRAQQVHDGAFGRVELVPTHAMTVTIPAITRARYLSLLATGQLKAAAVAAMLEGPISTACPASIVRCHRRVAVYIDAVAAVKCTRRPR